MKVDHDSEDFPEIENIYFADPLKSKLIHSFQKIVIILCTNCSGARRSTIHHSKLHI